MNEKRLLRIEEGRMIAGVCTGLAAYLGVDPTLIRVIFVLLAIFGGGGLLIYLILWLIMPMGTSG
ncbi:MAG: PspC domain-containing protein [Chloroflexota bacterium]|jgi:phage shock protein C